MVTVRSKSTILVGACVGGFVLVVACMPVGGGIVRAVWALAWLGLTCLAVVRGVRMGVTANPDGLLVRNLGRDHRIPWREIESIETSKSDNVTGAVSTISIHRTDGSQVIARGASAYSRPTVERWRDELLAAGPRL